MTRRAVLATGTAGIASTVLTASAAGNPGDKGPYLTGSRVGESGANTDAVNPDDSFLRCDPDENAGFDDLNLVVHSSESHPVYIYYYDGYREEAETLSAHLTIAQDHVHKYLVPPAEHESVIVIYPESGVPESESPVACYGGSRYERAIHNPPGDVLYSTHLRSPSVNPPTETDSGINPGLLHSTIQHVWGVAQHHRDSVEISTSGYERVPTYSHPNWLSYGVPAYLTMTVDSQSPPYGYSEYLNRGPGEWAEQEQTTVSELDWTAVNEVEKSPRPSIVGAIAIEYIVEAWGWKEFLETNFGKVRFWEQIERTLGVTQDEFETGMDNYITQTYNSSLVSAPVPVGPIGSSNSDWISELLSSVTNTTIPLSTGMRVPLILSVVAGLSGGMGAVWLLNRIRGGSDDTPKNDPETESPSTSGSGDEDPEIKREPEPESASESESDSESKSESKPEAKVESEPEPEPEHESRTETQTESEREHESGAETETETENEPESEYGVEEGDEISDAQAVETDDNSQSSVSDPSSQATRAGNESQSTDTDTDSYNTETDAGGWTFNNSRSLMMSQFSPSETVYEYTTDDEAEDSPQPTQAGNESQSTDTDTDSHNTETDVGGWTFNNSRSLMISQFLPSGTVYEYTTGDEAEDSPQPTQARNESQSRGDNTTGVAEEKSDLNDADKRDDQVQLQDLDGVGPAYKRRLNKVGIESASQLANYDAERVATATGINKKRISKFVRLAQELTEDESEAGENESETVN